MLHLCFSYFWSVLSILTISPCCLLLSFLPTHLSLVPSHLPSGLQPVFPNRKAIFSWIAVQFLCFVWSWGHPRYWYFEGTYFGCRCCSFLSVFSFCSFAKPAGSSSHKHYEAGLQQLSRILFLLGLFHLAQCSTYVGLLWYRFRRYVCLSFCQDFREEEGLQPCLSARWSWKCTWWYRPTPSLVIGCSRYVPSSCHALYRPLHSLLPCDEEKPNRNAFWLVCLWR